MVRRLKFLKFLKDQRKDEKMALKTLRKIKVKTGGRDRRGRISVRHQGGGEKRFLRKIDFKRDKKNIEAKVASVEYDPNRGADIALLHYKDGEKRYILAPLGLKVGDKVISGKKVDLKVGNALPLGKIPIGEKVHNIELTLGKGGQIVRGAGTAATILAKEGKYVQVKFPSGEIRRVRQECFATLGQVGNAEKRSRRLGKAGKKRHLGIRPTVRGVAQHPAAHPHGGGEGRSGIGMPSPKSPWGKKTLGKRTRKRKKQSDKYIVRRRK